MHSHSSRQDTGGSISNPSGASPVVVFGVCWVTGVGLGLHLSYPAFWLILSLPILAAMVAMLLRGKTRPAAYWGLVATVPVAAAWAAVCQPHTRLDDIARLVETQPRLIRVTGQVETQPKSTSTDEGDFSQFRYQSPATSLVLKVRSVIGNSSSQAATGQLLVRLEQADHRLQAGDVIEATGWLQGFHEPSNPGEFDFKQAMHRRGIAGQLKLLSRGNWHLLDRPALPGLMHRLHLWAHEQALASLHLGLENHPKRLAFLDALLLGDWKSDLNELNADFRQLGLSHLLSISGAHLGILIWLTWLAVKLFVAHPRKVMLIVLGVLGVYLLAIPLRVPIVRSAIMAGLWCTGIATARLTRSLDTMALAAVVVLIWKPTDLLDPGFQLSFGIVAGLLIFTEPVSHWLWPKPLIKVKPDSLVLRWARWAVSFLAANVVAFLVAMPVVAYHFHMISPWTVLFSIAAFPLVTAVMAVGYLKILLGAFLPSLGLLLARPLQWTSDLMTGPAAYAARWPAVAVELTQKPSLAWVVGSLLLTVALLSGKFAKRPVALLTAAGGCALWLVLPASLHSWASTSVDTANSSTIRLNMLAVGNGSCFVLRFHETDTTNPAHRFAGLFPNKTHVLMFDCGSQGIPDVGSRIVVPALKRLGVQHVDSLILSHADLDHFSGCPAVVDHIGVGRVLMPPQMLAQAKQQPYGATAYLVEQLRQRGIPIKVVAQGWQQTLGRVQLDILWPPADLNPKQDNDTSLVLSARTANNRLLLTGDIQQQAITALLATGLDLHADICDLPHHGSFVRASGDWLKAVSPRVVLQSSGPSRLLPDNDRWPTLLGTLGAQRLASVLVGMVQLNLDENGIRWKCYRNKN